MVFFSCNVCGEALKKNQVDKHCMTKCRSCEMVSCIDCGKDFWGNDYENHTKCISEDQKYSGKGYVAKVNKGEAKQDRWIEQVQIAIDKHKNNPRLRGPLETLKNYPNIPRKKNKFENFLQNSLRIRDRNLISLLWGAVMEEAAKNLYTPPETTTNTHQTNGNTEKSSKEENGIDESENAEEEKKLSKRERKEERRKKANKKEKKDKETDDHDVVETNGKVSKKSKKRKQIEEEEEEDSMKKRKKTVEDDVVQEEEEEEEQTLKKKTKFNWESVITDVLKSKGEISVKKLKKKVLSEYVSQMGEPRSEEKLWSKFDKKLSKNPTFKVLKERVKLIEQS